MTDPGVASKLWSKLHDMVWECRLGIFTRGITAVPLPGSNRSMTLPYANIVAILDRLSLTPYDVLVDVGSGKGRLVCCAARFPLRKVIGIEHFSELCAAARRNADRMRKKKAPITIVHTDAEEFDYRQGTVFYFYNPFGPPRLDRVLMRVKASLDAAKRPVRLAFANAEHDASFRACSWLEQYDYWDPSRSSSVAVPVSFWRSI